jgi:predicted homoserine dehydrogenase-like protein
VVAANGRTAMIGLPRHLLGLEAATSVLEAALLGVSSGADRPRPLIDLVAHADADLPAGMLLEAVGHHHSIRNVSARMLPSLPLADDRPVPYYLAAGRRLVRDVRGGRPILCADVALGEDTALLRLRRAQDDLVSRGDRP